MKTREQVETFRSVLKATMGEVQKNPEAYGVKDVEMFIVTKEIQLGILDWVLEGETKNG